MPNPPQGAAWLLQEEMAPSGEVTRSLEPRLPDLGHDDEREVDLDVHYTLSAGYEPGHALRIEVDRPIRIEPPALFTKFEVVIFDNVSAFIGLDRDAAWGPGQYDRRHPGSAVDDQRCKPHRVFSIVFRALPANPVEVHLFGGRQAQAK